MSEFENFCTLCNLSLPSESASLSHFNSQAHKKKLMSPAIVHKCDICNVSCTGEIPFQAHLNSKKHLHKVAVGNTATADDQNSEEDDGPLNCEVCHKIFGSRKPARDHFSSDSHKKKVMVYEEIKNSGATPLHCELCFIKCIDEEQLNVHLASSSHKKKTEGGKFKKIPKIKSGDGTNKDGEDDGSLENSVVDNGKPPVTYEHCLLCSVKLVSGPESAAHYNSQKHKKKLVKPTNTVLVCEVCNVTCTGSIPFEAHMKSKQHLKKSAPPAEKNTSDGLPPTSESNIENPPQEASTDNNHCDGSVVSPKSSQIVQENNKSTNQQDHVRDGAESGSPEKEQDDSDSPKKAKRMKKAPLSCEHCPVKGLDEKQMAVHILDHKKELEEKKSPKEAVPTRSLRKRKSDSAGSTVDDKFIKLDE